MKKIIALALLGVTLASPSFASPLDEYDRMKMEQNMDTQDSLMRNEQQMMRQEQTDEFNNKIRSLENQTAGYNNYWNRNNSIR